ncbi:MAG: NUDIX hydrolase [Gammaproteobacteria bacterium]
MLFVIVLVALVVLTINEILNFYSYQAVNRQPLKKSISKSQNSDLYICFLAVNTFIGDNRTMSCSKQFAALPYIYSVDRVEVCLITSRETARWVIPKGWPQEGLAPHELAALEAFEEAGLRGSTEATEVGRFRYQKRLEDGSDVECDVSVYPMLVDYQAIDWPEKGQRSAIWVEPKRAKRLVDCKELSDLLGRFNPSFSWPRKLAVVA